MSFDSNIRSTGNFNRQFGKQGRRIQLSEIPKSDIDTLQSHVVDLRHQIHSVDVPNTIENVKDIQIGPNEYYLEPDYNTVKIRTLFRDVYGIGNYQFQTINSNDYHTLQLYDQAATGATMWYCIPNTSAASLHDDDSQLWRWEVGFKPSNLMHGNSIWLNVGDKSRQMLFWDNIGTTHFDFTATNLSIGFWINPTSILDRGSQRIVALRYIDSNNFWVIRIGTDAKLWVDFKVGGVETKREYATPLVSDTWYFISVTWNSAGPAVVLKVNNNADTSSTRSPDLSGASAGLFMGSFPGASNLQDFEGYLTGITYYRNTVLSAAEMTSLYTLNTKSTTTLEPFVYGYGQYG